jgi:hypothetical protein
MGELVKAERDTNALKAALAEFLKLNGMPLSTDLWDLNSVDRSQVILRAHSIRKDFE